MPDHLGRNRRLVDEDEARRITTETLADKRAEKSPRPASGS